MNVSNPDKAIIVPIDVRLTVRLDTEDESFYRAMATTTDNWGVRYEAIQRARTVRRAAGMALIELGEALVHAERAS